MFSYVTLEDRVPQDHPLRPIRKMVDEILRAMAKDFDGLYAKTGRPGSAGDNRPACAAWKSGKPIIGFPLFHPVRAMTTAVLDPNPKPRKGGRAPRGLLILLCRFSSGRVAPISCSFFDWKMLSPQSPTLEAAGAA